MGRPVPPLPPFPQSSGSPDPAKPGIALPKDHASLARLRDQLEDYLMTLEQNTESLNDWLEKNRKNILIGHHRLSRAITHKKDEATARNILASLGEAAGFVLSISDFETLARETFGADSTFLKTVASTSRAAPARLLKELPAVSLSDDGDTPAEAQKSALPARKEEKGIFDTLASWVKRDAEKQSAEEEKRAREDLRRQWLETRNEIISLQSERHYYIDSFMDWVAETLEPDQTAGKPTVDGLMLRYQDPAHVIRLAEQDFTTALLGKTDALREEARLYSGIADAIDRQDDATLNELLSTLHFYTSDAKGAFLRETLLEDFKARSIADIALTALTDKKKQEDLFISALLFEKDIALTGANTPTEIFESILARTLDRDPLSPHALNMTMIKLFSPQEKAGALVEALRLGKPDSAFERISARFPDDLATQRDLLRVLLSRYKRDAESAVDDYIRIQGALKSGDSIALQSLFFEISSDTARGIRAQALWSLCQPQATLLESIIGLAGGDKKTLSALMDAALGAGLLKDFCIRSAQDSTRFRIVGDFFRDHVLDDPESFNTTTARRLLGATFAHGGLDLLRKCLTAAGTGWLQKIAESQMQDDKKLQWTSILLEPFPADVVKSNILAEAAERATAWKSTHATLCALEKSMAGDNIRLSPDRMLLNPHRIANVWYNGQSRTLKYIAQDTTQSLLTDVSPVMAGEILSFLKRRFAFLPETDGLFRPEKIDRLETTYRGTKMFLHNRNGDVHADAYAVSSIRQRRDFAHFRNDAGGTVHSVNLQSVLLIQPLSDGSHLLIDRYGAAEVMQGKLDMAPAAPLIPLGGAWLNPANAAILALHPETGTLQFRSESSAFDELLEQEGNDHFFYTLQGLDSGDFQKIDAALQDCGGVIVPDGAYDHLRFNVRALGYLGHTVTPEHGFECNRHGILKNAGFIQADPDLIDALTRKAKTAPGILQAGEIVIHKDCIDDAYFDPGKGLLYIVSGHRQLTTACNPAEAFAALEKLSNEADFMVAGMAAHAGKTRPADIVNLGRATLLGYVQALDRMDIVAEHERFHVNLTQDQSRAFLDRLEVSGLKNPDKPELGWTADLRKSMHALPPLAIRIPRAMPDRLGPLSLFEVVTGALNPSSPQIQKDFSIATRPLQAGEILAYPPGRKAPAEKPQRNKKEPKSFANKP